jgi:hypothetical protein
MSRRKNQMKNAVLIANPIQAIIPIFAAKSVNERWKYVPRIRLGGSPTIVEAPPILDAAISERMSGSALTPVISPISRVKVVMKSMTAMLPMNAERNPVRNGKRMKRRSGSNLTHLALCSPSQPKKPDRLMVSTTTIMPNTKMMASQFSYRRSWSGPRTKANARPAPRMETTVLSTFSEMISP